MTTGHQYFLDLKIASTQPGTSGREIDGSGRSGRSGGLMSMSGQGMNLTARLIPTITRSTWATPAATCREA
jgi:hypothetical protein